VRRFVTRWRGGHRDPALEAEAQRAYREAIDEARRERIAELERERDEARAEVIRLRARLRVAEIVRDTPAWMGAPARAARNLDPDLTVVVPSSVIRRGVKGRHR